MLREGGQEAERYQKPACVYHSCGWVLLLGYDYNICMTISDEVSGRGILQKLGLYDMGRIDHE